MNNDTTAPPSCHASHQPSSPQHDIPSHKPMFTYIKIFGIMWIAPTHNPIVIPICTQHKRYRSTQHAPDSIPLLHRPRSEAKRLGRLEGHSMRALQSSLMLVYSQVCSVKGSSGWRWRLHFIPCLGTQCRAHSSVGMWTLQNGQKHLFAFLKSSG
ncbi:hypothetical protein CC86DRAFT_64767 [Ophiobolus disseminans]|uniref:Uncharacterized protein n=1 Tax=Ophiobolus disseminans TaxID=1469910 RepID=A0A6A6ZQY3_9PLEO|nr:hypothetical protein CC86DRAFT_64767 [Ophiobolus disseminans]